MEMPTGTIKKLVSDRGFGFIKAEDGQEYFFHRSGTEGDFDGLQGGEKVSFEIESSRKARAFLFRRGCRKRNPPHRLGRCPSSQSPQLLHQLGDVELGLRVLGV